jgi:hypothetical protein
MLINILIAFLIIFGALAGWIGVQSLSRAYAARHPEYGPAREDGEGCGGLFCLCKDRPDCSRKQLVGTNKESEDTVAPIIPLENAHSNNQE